MKKRRGFTVALLMLPAILLFIILYDDVQYAKENMPVIKAGFVDMQKWDIEENPALRLTGEWELYPNLLLNKDEIEGKHSNSTIMQIPLVYQEVDIYGQPLPEFRSATFRIHVVNAPVNQKLGISIGEMTAAYRLYIDDQLIAANGQFTDTPLTPISAYRSQIVPFPAEKNSFDIILQMANKYEMRGLIQWPVELGNYNRLAANGHFRSAIDLLTAGGLLIMSILILFFALIVPWKKELLILGAFGIVSLIVLMFYREVLITDLIPQMPLALLNRVNMIANYAQLLLLAVSLAVIYPKSFPRWFMRPLLIYFLGLIAYVVITPTPIYRNLDWPDILNMFLSFGIIIFVAKAVLENKSGAAVILIFMSCLATPILVYAITGDSYLLANVILTGSGLIFASIIIAECIIVSRNYIQARQLELSALRDQIRPHFVHNALAAIISISRTEPDRSRNLLVNFSTYLRGRFDFTSMELIPIEQELEIVRAYVALEQARFGNRIQVQYQIEASNFLLPPLILQPLVENALTHGLQGDLEGVSVVIYTRYINKMVRLGVRDDGPGMRVNTASETGRKGVGLGNINLRLTKIYGSQLNFLTPANGGCDVSMDIPYKEVPTP